MTLELEACWGLRGWGIASCGTVPACSLELEALGGLEEGLGFLFGGPPSMEDGSTVPID